jgi:hypothetical protein
MKLLTDIIKKDAFINDLVFFHISNKKSHIPWYKSTFAYYFYIINNETYVQNFTFNNVIENYFIIRNNKFEKKCSKTIEINLASVLTFSIFNAGHMFCEICDFIYKMSLLPNKDDYNIIIIEDLINFSPLLTSLIYKFFSIDKIIIIDDDTYIKCDKLFITNNLNSKKIPEINYVISELKIKFNDYVNIPIFENIFLIKSNLTKNTNPENKMFDNEYNTYFINKGFKMLIPENYKNITELYYIINNSKNIIMSWGCCSYLNSCFVNENSNILVIVHKGYQNEIDNLSKNNSIITSTHWFPEKANKKLLITDLDTDLNENTIKILNENINLLSSD